MDPVAIVGGPAGGRPLAPEPHSIGDVRPPAPRSSPQAPSGGVEEAAQGFEAIFMRQMLRELRKTTSIDGENSYATAFYNDMFDDYLAEHLTRAGGLGLAGVIRAYVERDGR